MTSTSRFALYLRTIIFGIIDSLVSTVGLLAGLAVAHTPNATIILTGVVYAAVEALSMAVGNFLSEESAEEYDAKADVPDRMPITIGIVMFVVFLVVAFIPIAPYILARSPLSLLLSVALSILALFVAGAVSARIAHVRVFKRALRMALLGGVAIAVGITVAVLLPEG